MENEKNTQIPIETEPTAEAPVAEAPVAEPEVIGAEALPKKKKSFKGIIIGGIAAVCVAAVAAVVLMFPYITNFAVKTFTSGEKYQQHVVSKSAEDIADMVANAVELVKADEETAKSYESKVSLKIGDKFKDMIADYNDEDMDLGWMNDLSFNATSTLKNKLSSTTMSVALKNGSLASLEVIADEDTGKTYFRIPELSDKYVVMGAESTTATGTVVVNETGVMDFYSIIPDKDTVKALIVEYVEAVFENIEEVEKESEEVEIDGVSQKLTVLESSINETDVEVILKAVLKKAKDDERIEKIIKDYAKALDEDVAEAWEEYKEALNDTIEELDTFSDENDIDIKLQLYVNGKGDAVGFKLKSEDTSITYRSVTSGSKAAMELSVKESDEDFKISGSGKASFGKFTGEFDVKSNGKKIVKIEVKEYKVDSLKKNQLNGKFDIEITEDGASLMDIGDSALYDDTYISDCTLSLEFKSDGKTAATDISLKEKSDVIIGIALENKETDAKEIVVPADAIDISTDKYEYVKTVDLEGFISKIKGSTLPAEISSDIEELLRSNIDKREYWPAVEEYVEIIYGSRYAEVEKIAPIEFFNEEVLSNGVTMDEFKQQFITNYEQYIIPGYKDTYGDDYTITVKFEDSYRYDSYDLDDLKDDIYYNYNISKDKITEAYEIDVIITASGSKETEDVETDTVVVKIDGTWYLCSWSGYFGQF